MSRKDVALVYVAHAAVDALESIRSRRDLPTMAAGYALLAATVVTTRKLRKPAR